MAVAVSLNSQRETTDASAVAGPANGRARSFARPDVEKRRSDKTEQEQNDRRRSTPANGTRSHGDDDLGLGRARRLSSLAALRSIYNLCNEIKDGQVVCVRVHTRLTDILTELQKMEKTQRLPPSESLGRYVETLGTYMAYLHRYRKKPLVSRLVQHQKMMGELQLLHEEIDMVIKMLNLATAGAMMQWKQQWEEDQAVQTALLLKLVNNSDAVLSEVSDVKAQFEAMTVLQYEINRDHGKEHDELFRQGKQGDEIYRMLRLMQTQLIRASNVRVPATPAWFIPETDVEYDNKPFARGSFGAIHRGTLGSGADVVVKTVLLDDAGLTESTR